MGSEARVILDPAPEYVVPAKVSFVAADAQFTPKTVETKADVPREAPARCARP
jgi:HlyD family secretion protein